ncbi:MAG: hypothetical protein NT093_03945 [Candidatus Moranbacteria bacterium]|nr:hypothetical protein [Candidatus Moranbacteria bacterium]
MFPTALLSCPGMLLPEHLVELAKLVHIIPASCNLLKKEIQDALGSALIWIVGGNEIITLEALKRSSVRFIVYIGEQADTAFGAGAFDYCDENGIKIVTTGGGREAVALTIIEEMLSHMRYLQSLLLKRFQPAPGARYLLGQKRIVIVGAGGIGTLLLDMLYNDYGCHDNLFYAGGRGPKPELDKKGYRYIHELPEAFKADLVSLNLTLVPATTKIIGLNELRNLNPDGAFFNYARAWEVDPDELFEFLSTRPDARAIFDPFYVEGSDVLAALRSDNDPLSITLRGIRSCDNFGDRGHTATWRREAYAQYGQNTLRSVREILSGL